MGNPRLCGFCRESEIVESDNEKIRVYRCTAANCDAVEVITKGKSSWWYHGWERPDGTKINGDGLHDRRFQGKRFEWWRVYTEGADYETLHKQYMQSGNKS